MSVRHQINSKKAAPAEGTYSQGMTWNNLLFTTICPFGPSCEIVGETMEEQAKSAMQNLAYILEDGGSDFDHVLKVTAYIYDTEKNFSDFSRVYATYFPKGDYPARSSHEAELFKVDGKQCLLEMEVMAALK